MKAAITGIKKKIRIAVIAGARNRYAAFDENEYEFFTILPLLSFYPPLGETSPVAGFILLSSYFILLSFYFSLLSSITFLC
jgi:hypothetical protein